MLLSSFDDERLISKNHIEEHRVVKYEFRPIMADEIENSKEENDTPQVTTQVAAPSDNAIQEKSIEKELIETLLQKTDELSSSLANLQMQFEKQQLEMEEQINVARSDAYKDGFKEGEEKVKNELESDLQAQKTALIDGLIALNKMMQDSQKHLQELEKELSAIAVDIAQEVIIKEVEKDSTAIAIALAKELLGSISNATDVHIKVNNLDYPELTNALKDCPKIKIEADNAIKRGGVIISSGSGGIIDGTIAGRYKTLKQSVLDNLRDS